MAALPAGQSMLTSTAVPKIRRVVLVTGYVNLCKGIDGLAQIIGANYGQNPFEQRISSCSVAGGRTGKKDSFNSDIGIKGVALRSITAFTGEQIQWVAPCVHMEFILDNCAKAINRPAHIRIV